METHIADLTGIAIITTVAVLLGFVFVGLRQPPIVGYILTGVVLGPTGLGLVASTEAISLLAELGVIMLLFLVGMELSVRAFAMVAGSAALVAAGQIVAATALSTLFGFLFGWPLEQIILLGFIVAISSTAVAIQMLGEIDELRTPVGRITVGVLIAQDIAVVPMLIVVASMEGEGDMMDIGVKVGAALILLLAFLRFLATRPGKYRLPFTDRITGRRDMVALASVAFCFGAASVTGLAGLSAAFGAFLAGLVIAGSTLRGEAIAATHPIQSVLIVVFFLSIGLLIDLDFIMANLGIVIAFVVAVLVVKSVVNIVLLRLVGEPWEHAFPAGLIMAQIGEFSFVLAATGLAASAVTGDAYRLAIAVIAISILISPIWMISLRRFHDVAQDGISDFREALQEVYAHEIEEFERGRAAIGRVAGFVARRVKAGRIMLRRRRRAQSRSSSPASEEAKPAPEGEPGE